VTGLVIKNQTTPYTEINKCSILSSNATIVLYTVQPRQCDGKDQPSILPLEGGKGSAKRHGYLKGLMDRSIDVGLRRTRWKSFGMLVQSVWDPINPNAAAKRDGNPKPKA
jgi:hypothetical protein